MEVLVRDKKTFLLSFDSFDFYTLLYNKSLRLVDREDTTGSCIFVFAFNNNNINSNNNINEGMEWNPAAMK